MEALQLSLRRVEKMLEMFEIKCPTFSALCKRRKKIPKTIWQGLIKLTSGLQHDNVAIDATGFSRANPSLHFVNYHTLKCMASMNKFRIYLVVLDKLNSLR